MINFDKDYEAISSSDIEKVENLIGARLPDDYKKHMLEFNGGSVPLDKNYVFHFGENELDFSRFHQMKHEDGTVEEYFSHKHDFLYPNLISIGTTVEGHLALRIKGNDKGGIYFYSSDSGPIQLTKSFADFINALKVFDSDF